MGEVEEPENCLTCSECECLDLYKESKDSVDAGNELFVYSLLSKKIEENNDLRSIVCANGIFLNVSCFFAIPLYEEDIGYLTDIIIQVSRDFKASIFLAFSGHYRQALQVLRCAFENLISGVYFHSDYTLLIDQESDKDELDRLERRFNEWKRNGRVNIRSSIEALRRSGILSIEEERFWRTLYSKLSRFVHTPDEFVTKVEHEDKLQVKGEIVCPAATYYNETQLREWSDYFQSVFWIMLKILHIFHREAFHTEAGQVAIKNLLRPTLEEHGDKISRYSEILSLLNDL